MNLRPSLRVPSRFSSRVSSLGLVAALALAGVAAIACGDIPVYNAAPPVGVLRGQFLYTGPPPCTENGRIVGNAILLVFDQRLLPPPEGLAARSYRIEVVPGDLLFAEAAKTLEYSPEPNTRVCPAPGTPNIFASAPWESSPYEVGNYQIRAFYDLDGDFHPAFRYSNLPTKGDITGGAIANITAALQGAAPQFTSIPVGEPDGNGGLRMPEKGVLVDNLTVAVALPSPLQRPYFHVAQVQPGKANEAATTPAPESGQPRTTMPADVHLQTASSLQVQPYLWTMTLASGTAASEAASAEAPPFFFKLSDPATNRFLLDRWDSNRNGVKGDDGDRVVGSTLNAPSLAPLVSLQKLDPTDPTRRTAQVPRVLNSAITLHKPALSDLLLSPLASATRQDTFYAAVRPTAVCVDDPANKDGQTVIVTPFELGLDGRPIIEDVTLLKNDVAALLGRNPAGVQVIFACLPPGDLSVNVVNPSGQAWTLPNESGVCMPGETANADGSRCGERDRLPSQDFVFTFGKAQDAQGCYDRFRALDDAAKTLYRTACLRKDEQTALDNGTLW